jgi:hypothetical protein
MIARIIIRRLGWLLVFGRRGAVTPFPDIGGVPHDQGDDPCEERHVESEDETDLEHGLMIA